MQASDLRPASEYSAQYGVKSLVYGPPGSAKTPITNSAPRPVLIATEPGLMSMKGSTVPTWVADTADRVDEFRKWVQGSAEVKNYDTICIDSLSQMAEHYLVRAMRNNKHGLAAYGQMSEDTFTFCEWLYFVRYKHTYLICKEEVLADLKRRPYFPGKELNTKIPHRYDLIMRSGRYNVPGVVGEVQAFQTQQDFYNIARDRSGRLNPYEPLDLNAIFTKIMAP